MPKNPFEKFKKVKKSGAAGKATKGGFPFKAGAAKKGAAKKGIDMSKIKGFKKK